MGPADRPAGGPGPGAPARVELRGWGWRHAGRRAWAVRDLDLVLEPGQRVLLLGESGAGKSTLLRALAGLLDPDSGESEGRLSVDGRAGLVAQDPSSSLVMARAGDDVAFGLENLAVPRELLWPRVDAALAAVGFPYGRDRPTAALSGGEEQRLALAGALALRPGLLLLDEPTALLDPAGAAAVREVLAAVTGTTVLLVEHDVEAALPLVDRVVLLAAGGGLLLDTAPERLPEHAGALRAAGVRVPGERVAPRPGPGAGDLVLRSTARSRRSAAGDVDLRAAEALAVTGPNGSGKSTLALLLGGLVAPDEGAVLLGDEPRPLHRWRAGPLSRAVGSVFQDPEHQFLTGSVRAELDLAGGARTDELLERLRLSPLAGANPFTLSGGQQRRLSVATALATGARVLVLDEPTFGQDARTWRELLHLLADLRDEGRSLVAVTHDEPFATALADRVLALDPATAPC